MVGQGVVDEAARGIRALSGELHDVIPRIVDDIADASVTAEQRIRAAAAVQMIGAVPAVEQIVAVQALHPFGAVRADQHIAIGGAIQRQGVAMRIEGRRRRCQRQHVAHGQDRSVREAELLDAAPQMAVGAVELEVVGVRRRRVGALGILRRRHGMRYDHPHARIRRPGDVQRRDRES